MATNRSTIQQVLEEHRLLALLRALATVPGYSANNAVLQDYLSAVGLAVSSEELQGHLRQLEEFGLVELLTHGELTSISLTVHGNDVAEGLAIVDGVLRPGPRCPY